MTAHKLRPAALVLAAALGCSSLLATPVLAAEPVATVNGKAIPQSRADALVAAQVAQGQPDTPELRKAVRDELVRREVLSQAAAKAGVATRPDVEPQLMLARQSVLINAYIGDHLKKTPISEELLKKEYEAIRKQLGDKEYKARHILVETADEAKGLIDRLNKGEKFEELAKASKDPGSRDRGGELGWAAPTNYVQPFSAAMIKLEKGKYTAEPVKSDFGYHIILLEDARELKLPSYEEARPQLGQRMQQQIVEKFIAEQVAKATVK